MKPVYIVYFCSSPIQFLELSNKKVSLAVLPELATWFASRMEAEKEATKHFGNKPGRNHWRVVDVSNNPFPTTKKDHHEQESKDASN